ncbi:MAG: TIGR03618 family F420-dependent PPOX class oxidoreductase [Acidimicrobiia bacterium]
MRNASDLTADELRFLTERHLATLTTLRHDNTAHVVAIAFGYDPGARLVRIISSDGTRKVRNIEARGVAAICQVDGPRWLTLEGTAHVVRDPDAIRLAIEAFEARYRPARENPDRVAIEISVGRILGRA